MTLGIRWCAQYNQYCIYRTENKNRNKQTENKTNKKQKRLKHDWVVSILVVKQHSISVAREKLVANSVTCVVVHIKSKSSKLLVFYSLQYFQVYKLQDATDDFPVNWYAVKLLNAWILGILYWSWVRLFHWFLAVMRQIAYYVSKKGSYIIKYVDTFTAKIQHKFMQSVISYSIKTLKTFCNSGENVTHIRVSYKYKWF